MCGHDTGEGGGRECACIAVGKRWRGGSKELSTLSDEINGGSCIVTFDWRVKLLGGEVYDNNHAKLWGWGWDTPLASCGS